MNTQIKEPTAYTIESVNLLKREMLENIKSTQQMEITWDYIYTIDAAGIQLFLALLYECKKQSIPLKFVGSVQDQVGSAFFHAGFTSEKCRSAEQLYVALQNCIGDI